QCWPTPINHEPLATLRKSRSGNYFNFVFNYLPHLRTDRDHGWHGARTLAHRADAQNVNPTQHRYTFWRTEMIIQDLEIAKELSHEERAAVRGGNTGQAGLNVGGPQSVNAGFLFASPVTMVQGPQINANTSTTTDVNVASILNSAYAGIGQVA